MSPGDTDPTLPAGEKTFPDSAAAPDLPDAIIHSPVSLRSASLMIVAVLMGLTALRLASEVFVPLVMGVLLSYALTPPVDFMVRFHFPRTLAAALLLVCIVGGTGSIAWSLSDDAVALIETLPDVAQKLRRNFEVQTVKGRAGTLDTVQKVASELERTADEHITKVEPDQNVAKVQIEEPKINVKSYLLPGTLGLVAAAGYAAAVLFIAFFLLASGNNFRRKMVKLAGPSLSEKKVTIQALDEIDRQIQRYLQVQVFTSAMVGLATWLSFLWIGVEHAAVWGVAAFVCNFIPYLGSLVVSAAAVLMGFVQFGTFEMALVIGSVTLAINLAEGYVLTPWLTSRASSMNPVAVFVGVLAWGWLWGIWGLFLGVPILMVIKTVCDRVDDLKAVGELLGE